MEFNKYFEAGWYKELKPYVESKEFEEIAVNIAKERKKNVIFPPKGSDLLFKIFKILPLKEVKVVILGNDPYYSHEDQYDGVAFSNSKLYTPQPSLSNILKEVEDDVYEGFNIDRVTNYSLYNWVEQGVLLTNTARTVKMGSAGSHLKYWKDFTLKVVEVLNKRDNIIWLLWGRKVQDFSEYITNTTHKLIKTSHPSPLGCFSEAPIPFNGSKCFSKCNQYLKEYKLNEIKW